MRLHNFLTSDIGSRYGKTHEVCTYFQARFDAMLLSDRLLESEMLRMAQDGVALEQMKNDAYYVYMDEAIAGTAAEVKYIERVLDTMGDFPDEAAIMQEILIDPDGTPWLILGFSLHAEELKLLVWNSAKDEACWLHCLWHNSSGMQLMLSHRSRGGLSLTYNMDDAGSDRVKFDWVRMSEARGIAIQIDKADATGEKYNIARTEYRLD